jgi:phage terminase large subunit
VADIDIWFPRKLTFLHEPHRYKMLYGGRAGIKSGSIAQFLLQAGHERPLRIPCARETMQSIRESVHQLLEDQIQWRM